MKNFWVICGVSALLVAGLGSLMLWKDSKNQPEPLVVFCAAALKDALEEIVPLYEQRTGVRIVVHYDTSEAALAGIKVAKRGDLFLPADDSFIVKAQKEDLLSEVLPLASMNAVLVVNPDANRSIKTWDDLFKDPEAKLGIGAEGAAIRELVKDRLTAGKWNQLKARSVSLGPVTNVANAVKLGGAVNAGIIWDNMVTNPHYSMLKIVKLKELEGITAVVKIGVVKSSAQPNEAQAFAHFVSSKCADIFEKNGFKSLASPVRAAPKETPEKLGLGWEIKP